MPPRRIAVCLEATPKQAFASALDWPGWCRGGRDEDAALKALARYAGRYAAVAEHTEVSFPSTITFDVAERVPGVPATAFAAPECRRPFPQVTVQAERATVTSAAARRLADLVTAAWATFDEIAAASPAELRKGPRGGGRDLDKLIDHVIGAETAYARNLGVKRRQPAIGDFAAIEELREAIAAVLSAPSGGSPLLAWRLDHPLRGPPDRLARPRARLGDAGLDAVLDGPPQPAGRELRGPGPARRPGARSSARPPRRPRRATGQLRWRAARLRPGRTR